MIGFILKTFNPKLLKLDKKESLLNIDIYYIRYVSKKKIYNIDSAVKGYVEAMVGQDSRNLVITSIDDYEIINESKIDSVATKNIAIPSSGKNKKVLNKLNELWNYIESKINASLENCSEIRFNSDDALPLNTPIKFYALTIVIRCLIMKDGKFYPEVYLDDALYEV